MSSQSNQSMEVNEADADSGEHTHNTAPTRFVEADGTRFAYRRFGSPIGTPIVLLQHFMGNLDNYDPAITDALARDREVIRRHERCSNPKTTRRARPRATDRHLTRSPSS